MRAVVVVRSALLTLSDARRSEVNYIIQRKKHLHVRYLGQELPHADGHKRRSDCGLVAGFSAFTLGDCVILGGDLKRVERA